MADIPYLSKTGTIANFLTHLQGAGVPAKVDRTYLDSVGFKSSSDRPIIVLLKFIGFLDSAGRPTEVWQDYRDKGKARKVLGKAVVTAYSDLFGTFPDAPRRDFEALMNYFRTKTGLADPTLRAVVGTFKALCELSTFEGLDEIEDKEEAPERKKALRREFAVAGVPSVSINIQLQLPATDNEEIYDKLFAALRKHLYTEPDRER